jgi:hypothetical protein
MSPVIVWGAAVGGRRQHAYDTYPESAWWPNQPPKSVCNNARSPEMRIVPAAELPCCKRCEVLAAQQIESGRAREESPAEILRAAADAVKKSHPQLPDVPLWLNHVADTWKDEPVLQEGPEQDAALALARTILGRDS